LRVSVTSDAEGRFPTGSELTLFEAAGRTAHDVAAKLPTGALVELELPGGELGRRPPRPR
jgi:hypothetical protein